MARCDDCGLPMAECNAFALAQREAEQYLRGHGYSDLEARRVAADLLPDRRKEVAAGRAST